jgi:hypothetical protein
LGKHPATVYRWIEDYGRSERLSVFLRKERSDRGARRLSNKVEKIIDAAIKKIYLTAERPDVAAVVEEVSLQCFNNKIKGRARWERSYCGQRRRSIRYARADRTKVAPAACATPHPGTYQSEIRGHRALLPPIRGQAVPEIKANLATLGNVDPKSVTTRIGSGHL